MTPAEIQNKIETLKVSRKKQINIEFEGYDPGHYMPQDRQIAELLSQLHAGGYTSSLMATFTSPKKCNASEKSLTRWSSSTWPTTPVKKWPHELLQKWERQVGLKYLQIKNAIATLGL